MVRVSFPGRKLRPCSELTAKMVTGVVRGLVLGVPDVSRERGCLQTSLEQLKATKDKKDKRNWNFRPREAREFLGRWDKNSNTVNTQQFHTLGVSFGRTKNPGQKLDKIRIFGIYVLRMLVA